MYLHRRDMSMGCDIKKGRISNDTLPTYPVVVNTQKKKVLQWWFCSNKHLGSQQMDNLTQCNFSISISKNKVSILMGLIELVTCDNKQYFGNIIYATRCFEPLVKHKPIWRRKTHHKMNMFVIITQCKKKHKVGTGNTCSAAWKIRNYCKCVMGYATQHSCWSTAVSPNVLLNKPFDVTLRSSRTIINWPRG